MRPLNLATQPFRNETLPTVLIALGAVLLAGITVQHALTIRRLLPGRTSAAHQELEALEQEASRLREESRQLRVARPEPGVIAQWAQLKELVDQRAFSWTGLFGVLEQALPPGVRLITIAPKVEKGVVMLEFTAAARSYEQGLELIQALEDRPEFTDVIPLSRDTGDESPFRYQMRYLPVAAPSPGASPAAGAPAIEEARMKTSRRRAPPRSTGAGREPAGPAPPADRAGRGGRPQRGRLRRLHAAPRARRAAPGRTEAARRGAPARARGGRRPALPGRDDPYQCRRRAAFYTTTVGGRNDSLVPVLSAIEGFAREGGMRRAPRATRRTRSRACRSTGSRSTCRSPEPTGSSSPSCSGWSGRSTS